jgi:hypothetical protein
MKKINEQQKKELSGGIGPMMLWVGIMGAVMVAQTVTSIISSVCDHYDQNGGNNKTGSSAYKKNSMYMRVSPFPARSAMSIWM